MHQIQKYELNKEILKIELLNKEITANDVITQFMTSGQLVFDSMYDM